MPVHASPGWAGADVTDLAVGALSIVLLLGLSVAARHLLELRVGLPRTIAAGCVGYLATGLYGTDDTRMPVVFATLQVALSLFVAMGLLALAEIVLPSWSRPLAGVRAMVHCLSRIHRYLQISGIAVRHGFGAYLNGRRGRAESIRGRGAQARSLRLAMEEAGVVFVKLGQLLSTRRDLLPLELADELSLLQHRVQPVEWEQLQPVLEEELGSSVSQIFSAVERKPLGSASVAQAHRARLVDGTEVVVKLQQPRARGTVERDLQIVSRIADRLESRHSGRIVGVRELADGFAEALREELDFRIEARNIAAVTAEAEADDRSPTVRIPAVHTAVSTERVLVLESLDGAPVGDAEGKALLRRADRSAFASALVESVLRQIMTGGVFHADPHPGNVLVLRDGSGLALIDFGSVGRLDRTLRTALQQLFLAVEQGDVIALRDALLELLGRPDGVDEHGLERSLARFTARHLGPGSSSSIETIVDLFRLVSRYRLSVPPEVAAVLRALGTLEGTATLVAPGFDVVAAIRSFAVGCWNSATAASSMRSRARQEIIALLPALQRLPRRLDRLTDALEHGRLSVNVRLLADERDRRVVARMVQHTLLTLLGAAMSVTAALLLTIRSGPMVTPNVGLLDVLGYNMLLISAVLVLRVLFGMLRTAR